MNWRRKATIMRICARLPFGDSIYKWGQRRFGTLNANPMSRLTMQIDMLQWLQAKGLGVEGKRLFEVGTGHKPIVPIGFFLSGAEEIITVDLNRRIDWRLTKEALAWIVAHRDEVEAMYSEMVSQNVSSQRFTLLAQNWQNPRRFLEMVGIRYLAPADAARTRLSPASMDYHISTNVLEHIPLSTLKDIFIEAKRILRRTGVAIHFVDPSDHFQHQDRTISSINFLQFSRSEWKRIAGNRFAYCNRLRVSDYLSLFRELSLLPLRQETKVDQAALACLGQGFPLDEEFAHYSPKDLCTTMFRVLLKPCGV